MLCVCLYPLKGDVREIICDQLAPLFDSGHEKPPCAVSGDLISGPTGVQKKNSSNVFIPLEVLKGRLDEPLSKLV